MRLALGEEFEIVEKLKANEGPWETIPVEDLQRDSKESPKDHCATLEVELCHSILRERVNIIIPPDCSIEDLADVLSKNLKDILPILIYSISDRTITDTVC